METENSRYKRLTVLRAFLKEYINSHRKDQSTPDVIFTSTAPGSLCLPSCPHTLLSLMVKCSTAFKVQQSLLMYHESVHVSDRCQPWVSWIWAGQTPKKLLRWLSGILCSLLNYLCVYFCFFFKSCHIPRLCLNSLCSPRWAYGNPPASVSQAPGYLCMPSGPCLLVSLFVCLFVHIGDWISDLAQARQVL